MAEPSWSVSGSYFESCNCDPICPCRTIGGKPGGQSTHGVCFGTLSWLIKQGYAGDVDLAGLAVVLSLWFTDAELPSTPWEVVLYVDERASEEQHRALVDIFLGRLGGTPLQNFASAIGNVHAVRSARIELDHTSSEKRIGVDGYVRVRSARPYEGDEEVRCGIPGFEQPGSEYHTAALTSEDEPPLRWDVEDVCGFASDFAYRG
jgi:hypothetical protein